MPNWLAIVREHLPRLPVDAQRESEITDELAQQLEDAYAEALTTGLNEQEALEKSLGQFPDWKSLHRAICCAEEGEGAMNRRTKVYWIPWLAATVATGAWIVLTFRIPLIFQEYSDPSYYLLDTAYPGFEFLALLAPLVLIGAFGASAAWRMGGRFWERVLAGVFPALLLIVSSLVVYEYTESPFRGMTRLAVVRVTTSAKPTEPLSRGSAQPIVVRVVPIAKQTEQAIRGFPPHHVSRILRSTVPPAILMLLLGTVPFLFPANRIRNGRPGLNA